MTDNPRFSPQRSAAIRQLLIENVEAEPKRRSRHLRALLAGLVITGVVASGSTALALNRDALFSAPTPLTESPSNAPVPTASPTSAPEPAPPGTTPIAVGGSPILSRDVTSPPTSPNWSMSISDLGEAGGLPSVQNIADGYALVSVRPEHSPQASHDAEAPTQTSFSLSLIDTRSGIKVWGREWQWSVSPGHDSSFPAASALGSSGRILVLNDGDTSGPHEVLDLPTGTTIAPFDPAADNEILEHVTRTHDASGDVLATFGVVDAEGNRAPFSFIRRLSPGQSPDPVWSTRIDGSNVIVDEVLNGLGYSKLFYFPPGATTGLAGVLDLATGVYSPRDTSFDYNFFTGYTIRMNSSDPEGFSSSLTGLGDNGDVIWTGTDDQVRGVSQVQTAAYQAGDYSWSRIGTGQFIRATDGQFSLVDGLTGTTVWNASAADWGIEFSSVPIGVGTDGEALLVTSLEGDPISLRVDPATGENLGEAPWLSTGLQSEHAVYNVGDGTISATDIRTGNSLWSIDSAATGLFFAGGYLVATDGNTLWSVG